MSEMRVVGVRVELPANQPILLLRETEGERYLPIWIGSVEATFFTFDQLKAIEQFVSRRGGTLQKLPSVIWKIRSRK